MIKTFVSGIVLGVAAVIAALYFIPLVDQYREVSIIAVAPNGGNAENFHVNIPMDRIMVGDRRSKQPLPPGLEWPNYRILDETRTELFKIRNSRNAVVGVASRLAARSDAFGDVIEWVLHLPARGTMFVTLNPEPAGGGRTGAIRAGTREFLGMVGSMSERWVADTSGAADAGEGRIHLNTTFMARASGRIQGNAP